VAGPVRVRYHDVSTEQYSALTETAFRIMPTDQREAPLTGRALAGSEAVHSISRDLKTADAVV